MTIAASRVAFAFGLIWLAGLPAYAADQTIDRSGYNLLNPAPDSALRTLSTDRPTKSTTPITVDAGHFQIESDFANFSYNSADGTKTRTFQALDPVFKLGVTNSVDVEVQFNGFQSLVVGDGMGGVMRGRGFGDVFLRTKFNIVGNDGGNLAIAALPYIKLPSQRALISNNAVEGGVLVPIQYQLPSDFLVLTVPEVDVLKNANNNGRHTNYVNLINLQHPVPGVKDLTAEVEFYSSVAAERASPNIYTADFALEYLVNSHLQLDGGLNVGLNKAAPKLQAYTGISYRF